MSRIGDQLTLALDDVRLQRVVEPWEGRSPRELTAAYERFILKAQAVKNMGDVYDGEQFDLWLPAKKAPRVSRWAPSLLPLPRRVK